MSADVIREATAEAAAEAATEQAEKRATASNTEHSQPPREPPHEPSKPGMSENKKKYKNRVISKLKDPLKRYPSVTVSLFKYYDLDAVCPVGEDRPYIIRLHEPRVNQALKKERQAVYKAIARTAFAIIVLLVITLGVIYAICWLAKYLQ